MTRNRFGHTLIEDNCIQENIIQKEQIIPFQINISNLFY